MAGGSLLPRSRLEGRARSGPHLEYERPWEWRGVSCHAGSICRSRASAMWIENRTNPYRTSRARLHMNLHLWPAQERPREKLLAQGARSLSDAELLAVLLGS